MNKVFLHIKNSIEEQNWTNLTRRFVRLPIAGEYIAIEGDSDWYKVKLVVHCAFSADYVAEIYAIKIDSFQIMANLSI